jgi:outer membrane protein TolC
MQVTLWPTARSLALTCLIAASAMPASAQAPPGQGQAPSIAAAARTLAPQAQDRAAGPVKKLTVDEAVALGLENNPNLRVERISPLLQDANIDQARSAWSPNLTGLINFQSADSPPDSLLSGSSDILKADRFSGSVGVSQLLPWGTQYEVTWDSSRQTTNSFYSNFNPRLGSGLTAAFSQPLLRNFSVDSARTQLLISRRNREISDVDLRGSVVSTIRDVKAAYWDLAYAVANLRAQQQSLDLARQTLKDNRTRVDVGTMAPIDIVEAEAEVARNEETVIVAESNIKQAEDVLRALIFDPVQSPDFWRTTLEPVYDIASFTPEPVDAEEAVRSALERRTDLKSARMQLENTDLNLKYYRNQLLPQVDLQGSLFGAGVGGDELIREPGFPPGPIIGTATKNFGEVVGDSFTFDYPTWAIGVSVSYPLGTSAAAASLTRAKLQYQQGLLQIASLETQITTQVRTAARQVNTNIKRIDATRASRVLSERRLEAEQKKFGVGMSTSFLVFQAQRDLSTARNNELQALLDYVKSRADYEALQETSLSGAGITIGGGGNVLATSTGSQLGSAVTRAQQ